MSSSSSSSPPFFHASTLTATDRARATATATTTSISLVTPLSVPRAVVMKYVSTSSPDHDTTTTSTSSSSSMMMMMKNSREDHSMVRKISSSGSSSGSGSGMTTFTDTYRSINMPTDSSDDCYGSCNVKDHPKGKIWDAHHPSFSSATFSSSSATNLSRKYNDSEQLGVHCWTMNQKQEQNERLIPAATTTTTTTATAAVAAAAAAPAPESHCIVLQTKQEQPEKREYSLIALLHNELLVGEGKLEPYIVQQEQQRQEPQVQVLPEVQVQAESEAQALSSSKTTKDLQSKPDPIHSDVSKKRKRWKKPAIKKPKRFGFPLALPPHGGYHSCTDSCSNSSSCESSHNSTRPTLPYQVYTQTKQNKKQKQQKQDKKEKQRNKSNTKNLHIKTKKKKQSNNDSQKPNAQQPNSSMTTTKSKYLKRSNTKQGTDHPSSKAAMTTTTTANSKKFVKMKSFDKRLEDLKVFRDEFGHCDVPYTYPPNQPLSNWCANLRYSYGQVVKGLTPTIKMTEERIDQLRQVGFDLEASTSMMNKNHKKQAQKKKKMAK